MVLISKIEPCLTKAHPHSVLVRHGSFCSQIRELCRYYYNGTRVAQKNPNCAYTWPPSAFLSPTGALPQALQSTSRRAAVEKLQLAHQFRHPGARLARGPGILPDVSFDRDRDDRQEPGRRQLLALHCVRGRVERFAAEDDAAVPVPKLALMSARSAERAAISGWLAESSAPALV